MKQAKARIFTGAPTFNICAVLVFLTIMNAEAFSNNPGYGARPVGMGQAFTAVADDANAMNVNPAGLPQLLSPEITAVYGKLHTGLTDDSSIGQGYFGFASPLRAYLPGAVGFAWNEIRLAGAYSETSFTLSYATAVYAGTYAGVNLKYLHKSYSSDIYTETDPVFNGGYSKGAFAADLGGFYRMSRNYTFGLMLKNINRPNLALSGSDRVPMEVRAGAAYRRSGSVYDLDLGLAAASYDLSFGAERPVSAGFVMRFGLLAGSQSRRSVNLGFGGRFNSFDLDYAFSLPLGAVAGTSGSHRLSFSLRFGPQPEIQVSAAPESAAAPASGSRLEDSLRAIKEAEARADRQERQINALEEKLARQSEMLNSISVSGASVARGGAQSTAAVSGLEAETDALKEELFRSRREAEQLKAKAAVLKEAVKTAPQSRTAAEGRKFYAVQDGDTLESIAAKVYGSSERWMEIYKANTGMIGRGGRVKAGQTLVIP